MSEQTRRELLTQAAIACVLEEAAADSEQAMESADPFSPWAQASGFRSGAEQLRRTLRFSVTDKGV